MIAELLSKLRGETSGMKLPKALGPADPVLAAVLVALVAFGVVMVFSASSVFAHRSFGNGLYFLVRQSVYAVLGLGTAFICAGLDYHRYRPLTYPILAVTFVLLLVVVLGVGRTAGGATRWIQLGPVNIQPAEVAKLAIIFFLAYSLSNKAGRLRDFRVGFLPHALVAGVLMLLCLRQPDFGSAVMIGVLTFVLLFVAGTKMGWLFLTVVVSVPLAAALILAKDYRRSRILGFLDPFGTRNDHGFQIAESLMSFGSGGVTGVGLGDSHQKLMFLPEAHTDFISAIIGEELGFVGIFLLIVAYATLVVQGMRAAMRAVDDYGRFLALGITTFVGLQAFTNLAVAMGMLPTKGLVLPFLSYGGSSLLVNCAAMGVLLNISRPREVAAQTPSTTLEAPGRPSTEGRGGKNVVRVTRNTISGGAA